MTIMTIVSVSNHLAMMAEEASRQTGSDDPL